MESSMYVLLTGVLALAFSPVASAADIEVSNGVIHVIDTVILPE